MPKSKDGHGNTVFTCYGCEAFDGTQTKAIAWRTPDPEDKIDDQYNLFQHLFPKPDSHCCLPSGTEDLSSLCVKAMLSEVAANPTKPIPTIYKTVRSQFTQKMNLDEKLSFLSNLPSYKNTQTKLYKERRKFIPAAPASQVFTYCLFHILLLPARSFCFDSLSDLLLLLPFSCIIAFFLASFFN